MPRSPRSDRDPVKAEALSVAGRHQILVEWNDAVPDYSDVGLLPNLLAVRAAAQPDAVALVADGEQVSYGELEAQAERLASRLHAMGVGPETIVGILLERSPATVAALVAIWKCDGSFLALDPEHPAERMAFILRDALRGPGPRIVLTVRNLAARLPGLEVQVIHLDDEAALLPSPPRPPSLLLPDHPAYVIYTSGSTGRPKGIVVSHRALANRILWACAAEVGPGDAFVHKTTLSFDVSLAEIFAPLAAGARCVLTRPGGQRDLAYLAHLIARETITHASFPPSTLQLLLELPDAAASLRSLRILITGGETVPPDLPAGARAVIPAILFNRYGPTEATISVLTGACDPDSRTPIVPLGRPIARARIFVLDDRMSPLPILACGEIYIGGICLARGYLGRPDLTAARFVPDPFSCEAGGRLYRTGDRARLRSDGAVEFLGRVDYQVKIRGFRVEIEEVEMVLNACPAVREAVVVACEEAATNSRRLVAYVIPVGLALGASELRRFLSERLAAYMVPSAFILCNELPRTLSGKVDRQALAAGAGREAPAEGASSAPRTELELALSRLLQDLLQVPRIGVDADLFELGCHSLLLVRFQGRLREVLGTEVALADIVRNPSVGALARFLDVGGRGVEIDAGQLAAEAVLESEIRPIPLQNSPSSPVPEAVLLTGATGFLGTHLLAELLDRTSAQLMCLVRAADEQQGLAILRRSMERYGLWREELAGRLVPVPGDLGRTGFGLSDSVFRELAETVDVIYHCGAQVNYSYPYETLRTVNVSGTREVLRLLVRGRAKTLHHVSTLAVLEKGFQRSGAAPEAHLDGDTAGLSGGYRQSKWVAERLVGIAIERGARAVIYRPGWITGSSRTGAMNPADFLVRLVAGSLQAGVAPDLGPIEVCPTPVDWVGAAIAWLSLQPGSLGQVFHLINPRPLGFERVLDSLHHLGHALRRMPVHSWAATLADLGASGGNELIAPLVGFLEQLGSATSQEGAPVDPQRYQPSRFASARTQAALASGSIGCPLVDHRLLELYLSFLGKPQPVLAARAGTISRGTPSEIEGFPEESHLPRPPWP